MQVKNGQNIFDVCLQEFGNLELIIDFLIQNELNFNSDLNPGMDLIVDNYGKGDQQLKDFYSKNKFVLVNADFDADYDIETFIAIQWPVFVDPDEPIYTNKIIQAV